LLQKEERQRDRRGEEIGRKGENKDKVGSGTKEIMTD
jgi:hypothetical protein